MMKFKVGQKIMDTQKRIIKFRAWDNTCKKMFENITLETLVEKNEFAECAKLVDDFNCELFFMQYTGLKEFYHYDIVETVVSAPWDNQVLITVTGEIVWANNQWWVDCFQSIDYSGNIGDYDWKKIGTRFENPELLGDKNGNI